VTNDWGWDAVAPASAALQQPLRQRQHQLFEYWRYVVESGGMLMQSGTALQPLLKAQERPHNCCGGCMGVLQL
jgi:hypothetical protein